MKALLSITLAAVALLTGCSSVLLDKPFGEHPVTLDKEVWEGTWVAGTGAMSVRVADAQRGSLRLAWVADEDDGFRLETREAFARNVNRTLFLSMSEIDDRGKTNFTWGRAVMNADELTIWIPNLEVFKRLVAEGTLQGTIVSNQVHLRALTLEQLDRIEKQSDGELFNTEHPLVLRRLKDR